MDQAGMDRLCVKMISYLESGTAPDGLFTRDVFCDFTPPMWRVQARGLDDVLAIRRRGHPGPGRVPRWNAKSTPDGFLMEVEETWTDTKGEWYCREVMIATVRDESIERLVVYCTGDWDKPRQEAHSAQVRLLEPKPAVWCDLGSDAP